VGINEQRDTEGERGGGVGRKRGGEVGGGGGRRRKD